MKTSEIIQYRRKFLGMTLEQVADAVGVNKSTIMRYERGDIEKMSVQNLVPLADALHCSPLFLRHISKSRINMRFFISVILL